MYLLAAMEVFPDGSDVEDYRRWRADAELIVTGLGEGRPRARGSPTTRMISLPGDILRLRIELLGERTTDAYGTPLREPRAQHLHGRLERRHVRRPDEPAAPRGTADRPPPSAKPGLFRQE